MNTQANDTGRVPPEAVTLRFIGRDEADLRWFIAAKGRHAGGITAYPQAGGAFTYGIAVAPDQRRRGIASSALPLFFAAMADRGYHTAVARIEEDNAVSLALHKKLGFVPAQHLGGIVTLTRSIAPKAQRTFPQEGL